jgi:hypothetical protein
MRLSSGKKLRFRAHFPDAASDAIKERMMLKIKWSQIDHEDLSLELFQSLILPMCNVSQVRKTFFRIYEILIEHMIY